MTRKQEVRYRTGRMQSGSNCAVCIHIVEPTDTTDTNPLRPCKCRIIGDGAGRGYTVTHDGICDRFKYRQIKHRF